MSSKLKPIYQKMINDYVKEYKKHLEISKHEYNSLLDIKIEIDSMVEGIKSITVDKNMNINEKYIIINESLSDVQKKMKRTSDLNKSKLDRENKLNKSKKVLISTCKENNHITEKDIIQIIEKEINDN